MQVHAHALIGGTHSVSDNRQTLDIFRSILQLVRVILRMCGNDDCAKYQLSTSGCDIATRDFVHAC